MLVRTFTTISDLILAKRLGNVTVAVGEAFDTTAREIDKSAFAECGSYPGRVGANITITCNRTVIGTYVTVWMAIDPTGNAILTLCEVEVYASESLYVYN